MKLRSETKNELSTETGQVHTTCGEKQMIELTSISDQANRSSGLHREASSDFRFESAFAPDLAEWDQLPRTQMIAEKNAAACPYVGGSKQRPRHIRTIRRWRTAQPRCGPAFVKIGGRYYYTIGALRDFYERSKRGDVSEA